MKEVTVSYVVEGGKILLGFCKKGMSVGKYNGFGGHKNISETILETAKRELKEESGLEAKQITEIGRLVINNAIEGRLLLHIFRVSGYRGEPRETNEMAPEWFSPNELPYAKMWPNDRHHMPYVIDNKYFKGHFEIDEKNNILNYEISNVESL